MSRPIMSMESALDEERLGVLALLEGITQGNQMKKASVDAVGGTVRGRAASPAMNPRSPVRSMLDIDPIPRHSSNAGTTTRVTSPGRAGPIRSMLDIGEGTVAARSSQNNQMFPKDPSHTARTGAINQNHPRSLSDAAIRPASFGPRTADRLTKADPTMDYQFSGYLTNNPGAPVAPKRNTLAGKKATLNPSAMAEAVRGELSSLTGRDNGAGRPGKSRSPHNRLGLRSNSPHASILNTNSLNILNSPGKFALDNGTVVDMNSAYRRLSDANLAFAGGSLGELSAKGRKRADSGNAASIRGPRLEKDYAYIDGEDAVADSSDEEGHTSDEELGRGRSKKSATHNEHAGAEDKTIGMGRAKGPRQALSLMAAAEEERAQIAQQEKYQVRSLLEPAITVTGPGGARVRTGKSAIHPTTAFDQDVSGAQTPLDSEEEADITDIKRAQKMSFITTPIVSTPNTNRSVRTIFRGDFEKMQKEAIENARRVRNYLVATDLSDEAAHALEWTVGTVLRDGDTILAIYCVDEETGISEVPGQDGNLSAQAESIAANTNFVPLMSSTLPRHPGLHLSTTLPETSQSPVASPAGRERSKAEQERYRAIQDITDRVSKLLRRTRLQVRVVIEVIHCKSPKHLITEVIDFLNPTLVILGSRGRSALKGVILGSFSNYLVTKSSVPVMVARKRLRKHSKYKRPAIRLANNLTNISGKTLATAKID